MTEHATTYPRKAVKRIALRFRLSQSHVSRIARGERINARVLAALERERTKEAK